MECTTDGGWLSGPLRLVCTRRAGCVPQCPNLVPVELWVCHYCGRSWSGTVRRGALVSDRLRLLQHGRWGWCGASLRRRHPRVRLVALSVPIHLAPLVWGCEGVGKRGIYGWWREDCDLSVVYMGGGGKIV
nr:hypothetical protein Itr_chr01CG08950 [Ipomoea trifida]